MTLLVLVVITALGFDFTNGFHDTGNAMATSIATGALPPRIAVALSGALNFVGALIIAALVATAGTWLLSKEAIYNAIASVTNQQPRDSDIARVRSRLAAGGWPLPPPSVCR
jgi:phosphate/sulfate permease